MKLQNKIIAGIMIGAFLVAEVFIFSNAEAQTVFLSRQVGSNATTGYVLQTNGATSTWVATSSLGVGSGGGGVATSGAGVYTMGNIAFFTNSSTVGGKDDFNFNSTTDVTTLPGALQIKNAAIYLVVGEAHGWYTDATFATHILRLKSDGVDTITFEKANSDEAIFDFSAVVNRTFTWPDAAGTVALTSNLPVGANPTAVADVTAVNGVATTFMRSDGAPAIARKFASSSEPFSLYNATTTTSTINPVLYHKLVWDYPQVISKISCYEVSGTTTIRIYKSTGMATTTVLSDIVASLVCGATLNTVTSFTSSTLLAGEALIMIPTSTAGTPQLTTIEIDKYKN